MDRTLDHLSNGEEATPEPTEITSPTDGEGAGNCPICECYFDTGQVLCMIHKPHEVPTVGKEDGKQPRLLPNVIHDNTPIELYTVRELQAILNLGYRGCLQWLSVNVTPLGGCVRVGRRNLYHRWAVNEALKKKEWQGLRHKKAGRSISPNRYFQKLHLSKKQSSE